MEENTTRSKQTIQDLYENILPVLAQHVHQHITPVIGLFENFVLERVLDTWSRDPSMDPDEKISLEKGNVQQLGLKVRLEGFNKPGVEPFDVVKGLVFRLEYSSYSVGSDKEGNWLEKQYLQRWSSAEYESVAVKWSEELIDTITEKLKV